MKTPTRLYPASTITVLAVLVLAACGGSSDPGPATLDSITVSAPGASLRFTQQKQLTATGNYSDGSARDLTGTVAWGSSDTVVADIVSGGADAGLVTGNVVGEVTISASDGALTGHAEIKIIDGVALPRSGQITCYDPAGGSAIECTGSGEDGELRAGEAWPLARFVSGTGAAADCVIDRLTGLMWTRDGNLPAQTNPGPLNGKRTWLTALAYPQKLNAQGYCGYFDWRLPNLVELESLVDSEAENQAANLNAQGFVDVQGTGEHDASGYWTSTTNTLIPGKAWGVDMHEGCTGSCHLNSDQANYVWPVRGPDATAAVIELPQTGQTLCYDELGNPLASCAGSGQDGEFQAGVDWPGQRFELDASGECISDKLTGLGWAKNANAPGKQTLAEALAYAQNPLCNASDWRLPNRKELFSLMFNAGTGTQLSADWLAAQGFSNFSTTCYWTSTNVNNGTGAGWEAVWYVHPDDAHIKKRNKLTTPDCATWPVRDGR